MQRLLAIVPFLAILVVIAGCTAMPAPAAKPATPQAQSPVLGWGQRANLDGVKITVRQPRYADRANEAGPEISYRVTITNGTRRTPDVRTTHRADSRKLPGHESNTDSVTTSSVRPGKSRTFTQQITVPYSTSTLTVELGLGKHTPKWRGKIGGTPAKQAEPEPAVEADPNHCDDPNWWNAQQQGDPSEYVRACREWPYWVDRGETPCLPDERNCPVDTVDPCEQTGTCGESGEGMPEPTAGYQCWEGAEEIYDVCRQHKEWVDGQVEYAECIDAGGSWNIARQTCDY